MTEQRVLPADVYDTMELSALAFGGIGGGFLTEPRQYFVRAINNDAPLCIYGHAGFAAAEGEDYWHNPVADLLVESWTRGAPIAVEYERLDSVACDNNAAVRAINARKNNRDRDARVSWEEYVAELNIVRDDS